MTIEFGSQVSVPLRGLPILNSPPSPLMISALIRRFAGERIFESSVLPDYVFYCWKTQHSCGARQIARSAVSQTVPDIPRTAFFIRYNISSRHFSISASFPSYLAHFNIWGEAPYCLSFSCLWAAGTAVARKILTAASNPSLFPRRG